MISIRRETPEDFDATRKVNEQAFGGKQEANIIEALRKRKAITLSLVADIDGSVVGHILFSPVTVEAEVSNFAATALGPMAVLPKLQRKGIGSRLVRSPQGHS